MEKILLAVGFIQLEEYLQKQLKKEFLFVGTTVYREGVIRAIGQKNPDTVIIRETLEGKENILKIVYEIRSKFPKVRVVFIAGKRETGDALLSTLVSYGVYDILTGEKIKAQEVVSLIRKPNEYKDVQHLQPVPVLDENTNKVSFTAPSAIVQEKEIIKEIYIERPGNGEHANQTKDEKPNQTKDEKPLNIEKIEKKIEEVTEDSKTIDDDKSNKKNKIVIEKKDKKEVVKEPKIGLLEKLKMKSEQSPTTAGQGFVTTKQKIITFMGSKSGVGNSAIAFNTALVLAQKGLKTIFIEMNDKYPSVSYWYELGFVDEGIDTALKALQQNDFEKVDLAIVKSSVIKTKESSMIKNYKKFPDKLDFMFFSNHYLTTGKNSEGNTVDYKMTKELFLYLIFQMDYDFVVLDVPSDIANEATFNGLFYSNKVFMTVTQDVSSIGYSIYNNNELSKKGVNLEKKLSYIVNKFEKSDLSLKEIEEWIQTKDILSVPCANKEFINANFVGLPISLYTKNAHIKTSIENIIKTII